MEETKRQLIATTLQAEIEDLLSYGANSPFPFQFTAAHFDAQNTATFSGAKTGWRTGRVMEHLRNAGLMIDKTSEHQTDNSLSFVLEGDTDTILGTLVQMRATRIARDAHARTIADTPSATAGVTQITFPGLAALQAQEKQNDETAKAIESKRISSLEATLETCRSLGMDMTRFTAPAPTTHTDRFHSTANKAATHQI